MTKHATSIRLTTEPGYRERYFRRRNVRRAERRDEIRSLVRAFQADGCSVCGETAECCLAAHHLDPNDKELTIGQAASDLKDPMDVRVELDKCLCVCANCHAKIHAGLLTPLTLGADPKRRLARFGTLGQQNVEKRPESLEKTARVAKMTNASRFAKS